MGSHPRRKEREITRARKVQMVKRIVFGVFSIGALLFLGRKFRRL